MNNNPSQSPTSNQEPHLTHVVLIPGFWLGAWAWADVEPDLACGDIRTHPLTLPGLDGTTTSGVTLRDHVDAVLELIDGLEGPVVLVGHSGGGAVAQGAIDRNPERVQRVVYVDSGPLVEGVALMPDAVGDVGLPTWEALGQQNCSIEGMDEVALARFRAQAVDEPGGVARSNVELSNDRRHDVPASVICTSFGSELLQQMIASGTIPSELNSVRDVRFVDLPTGHWPMFSRPADLAEVLLAEIRR